MKKLSLALLVLAMLMAFTTPLGASTPGELLIWADDARYRALEQVAARFADEYGIPIRLQEMGFGDIRDNLAISGPAGEGPDIIVGAHDWLGELVTNGLIEPVDLEAPEMFLQTALNAFTWGGMLYGVPYAIEALGMFYNADLVEGLPNDFEELIAIGYEMQEDGKWGLVMPQPDPYHTFPLFSAGGGYVFGEDEFGVLDPLDIGLANEGSVAGLELFQRLLDERILPRAIEYQEMMSLFQNGQAAFMMTGPWAIGDLQGAGVNFGFGAIPAIDGNEPGPFAGAQGFMISSFSENKMLAGVFLNEVVATLETMEEIYSVDPRPSTFLPMQDIMGDLDAMVIEAAENGVPMPAIPQMAAVWESWSDALELVINQQETPANALENAVALIRAIIAEGM